MQVLQVQLEVGPDPAEVGRARRWARSRLIGSGIDHDEPLAETLILLISELVTNAVVHTGCPAVLRMLFGLGKAEAGTVRVEVADRCARPPRRRTAEDDETNGRGLELVDGLADRWGWRQEGNGKAIWCEVDRAVPLGVGTRPGDTRGAHGAHGGHGGHGATAREIAAAGSGIRDTGREVVVRDGARGGAARAGTAGLATVRR
ncbi:ATP-binding protein [Streptomyces sp. NPDC058953]|uniref:ATP-binding protein n=1 Tax=unclassified Streptomyces TaxID=2593676 RepID=UPI0036AAED29